MYKPKVECIDGHVHIVPSSEECDHRESENCWCFPYWDSDNKSEYLAGLADKKVFIHRSIGEILQ